MTSVVPFHREVSGAPTTPHVEFANSALCPFKIGDVKEIEKIQKRATKLVI